MKRKIDINSPAVKYVLFLISCIIAGYFAMLYPYAVGVALASLVIFLLFQNNPINALGVFIVLVPFTGTPLFINPFLDIPGAKPLHVLAAFLMIIGIINFPKGAKIPRRYSYWLLIFISLFILAVVRSIPHLNIFNTYWLEDLTPVRYILSYLIKPLIYFIPFVIIVKYAVQFQEIQKVLNYLVWSLVVLSFYLLYTFLFKLPARGNVDAVNKYYQLVLGLHRNDLANFFIVGFPILLAKFFIRKNMLHFLLIIFVVGSIGFLYSRTAYFTVLLAVIFYLFISRRAKVLPIFLVVIIGAGILFSSSFVERASKGLQSGDRDEIFAGRIDRIWLPLIEEYSHNPEKLLLGNGRFAIVTSKAAAEEAVLNVFHPHNMYLEQIIDVGIIGFLPLIFFLTLLVFDAFKNLKWSPQPEVREYQVATLVALLSYFVAGITGRTVFPALSSSFFWVMLGLAIAFFRLIQYNREEPNAES